MGRSIPSKNPDDALLARYARHNMMAEKHRAHADLISAKMRVGGKRISEDYETGKKTIRPIHEMQSPPVARPKPVAKRKGKK